MLPITKYEILTSESEKNETSKISLFTPNTEYKDGQLPPICRVCLAIDVKMYNISENRLSFMHEQVTQIKINTKDRLPQNLCWECVARLSSANCYVEKALKSQSILLNIINSRKFITMNDIQSIKKSRNRLRPTLSKFHKLNDSYLHIIENSAEIINEYDNKTVNEKDIEFYESKGDVDINTNEEITSEDVVLKENQIKSEPIVIDFIEEEIIDDNGVQYETNNEESEQPSIEVGVWNEEEQNEIVNKSIQTALKNQSEMPHIKKNKITSHDRHFNKCKQDNQITFENGDHPSMKNMKNMLCRQADNIKIVEALSVSSKINATSENNLFIINDSKKVICDICDKTFNRKNLLINHILKHRKSFNCTNCKYKTDYQFRLDKHINGKHTKNKTFKCSFCDYKAYYNTTLKIHIKSKHTESSFCCSYCDYKTSTKTQLDRHTNIRHTKAEAFNCSYCSYVAYAKSTLTLHINSKHTRHLCFPCSLCNYKTHDKSHLAQHIKSKHTKSSLSCSYCDYKTSTKSLLDRHTNIRHTKAEMFICSYCSYVAYAKSTLTLHINSKHTRHLCFPCSICNFKTHNKSHLALHINSKHTKSEIFNCLYCNYKSYRSSNLKVHINVKHTKTVVYNCSLCNFKAYSSATLANHVNVKHTKNT